MCTHTEMPKRRGTSNPRGTSLARETKSEKLPLEGSLVLDATQALAGPYISTLLGDIGADVVHVELPRSGDIARHWPPVRNGFSYYFGMVNRNKKSLALDLGTEKGREAFLRLARGSDIVIENFTPGVARRLGIDYEKVFAINPDVIYCSVSGFGQSGPYRDRPAFDPILQGEAGMMSYTGIGRTLCRITPPITDYLAALYGSYAVLSGMMYRERTAKGLFIDLSIFDCAVTAMMNVLNMNVVEKMSDIEMRMGTKYHLLTPYEPFMAKDGRYVNVCVATERHWRDFCGAVGLSAIVDDKKFSDNRRRVKNRLELQKMVQKKIRQRTRDEWIRILSRDGVPCGSVNSVEDVIKHPQVRSRGVIREVVYPGVGKVKTFNNPVKFSEFETVLPRPPMLGEHTAEILNLPRRNSKR